MKGKCDCNVIPKCVCICNVCEKQFTKIKSQVRAAVKSNPDPVYFCSRACYSVYHKTSKMVKCKTCGEMFEKTQNKIKRSKNHFCSYSCVVSHNNKNRTTGYSRSKFEKWMEENLKLLRPDLEIKFNNRKIVGYELDIYIPSLNTAIEINGPHHYKPIYGEEILKKQIFKDAEKKKQCEEKGIRFYTVDISKLMHFTEERAIPYKNEILRIIAEVEELTDRQENSTLSQLSVWEQNSTFVSTMSDSLDSESSSKGDKVEK